MGVDVGWCRAVGVDRCLVESFLLVNTLVVVVVVVVVGL
jgi:hypothetical protein